MIVHQKSFPPTRNNIFYCPWKSLHSLSHKMTFYINNISHDKNKINLVYKTRSLFLDMHEINNSTPKTNRIKIILHAYKYSISKVISL